MDPPVFHTLLMGITAWMVRMVFVLHRKDTFGEMRPSEVIAVAVDDALSRWLRSRFFDAKNSAST